MFEVILLANGKITREQLARINSALNTVVQLSNQCDTSADCTTEPIGARACGGPGGYIVYSTNSCYVEYILSLAKLTSILERQYNEENSVISICSIVPQPVPICSKNQTCIAQDSSLQEIA